MAVHLDDMQSDMNYILELNRKCRSNLRRYNISICLFVIITWSVMGIALYSLYQVQVLTQDLEYLKSSLSSLQPSLKASESSSDIKVNFENTVLQDDPEKNYDGNLSSSSNQLTDETNDNKENIDPLIEIIVSKDNTLPTRPKRDIFGTTDNSLLFDSDPVPEIDNRNNEEARTRLVWRRRTTTLFPYSRSRLSQRVRTSTFSPIRRNQLGLHDDSNFEYSVYPSEKLEQSTQINLHSRHFGIDPEYIHRSEKIKPVVTFHLIGDTSKYDTARHSNYNGNGHMHHLQKTYMDWKQSNWIEPAGMNDHFNFARGVLTIKQSGIYFVYAQIYYLDKHDTNGYRVYKNGDQKLLQCTVTSHSQEDLKANTCYTAGVTYLNKNDNISVGDISERRYSVFEPEKSFFGIVKLGEITLDQLNL